MSDQEPLEFCWETCPVCGTPLPVFIKEGYSVACFKCKGPRYGRVKVDDDEDEDEGPPGHVQDEEEEFGHPDDDN